MVELSANGKKLRVLELFSGTASVGREFEKRGHTLYTVDNNPHHKPDFVGDIGEMDADWILNLFSDPDVVWASPPCPCFSVASIYNHWKQTKGGMKVPTSDRAKKAVILTNHVFDLVQSLGAKVWFIENPRGMMRHLLTLKRVPRTEITYCQYGDTRMKPTDIWTNRLKDITFKPPCKPKASCHERAPRGCKTSGTQRKRSPIQRAIIPPGLGHDLCLQVEGLLL